VGEFGDRVASDSALLDVDGGHPPVLLDLRDGRPHDVGDGHRPRPRAGGCLLSGEDQQGLGVAPHAGGEMVELEEFGEGVRVEFLALQGGDQAELAAEERLVAAAQTGQ
jgi:hypothetical protein